MSFTSNRSNIGSTFLTWQNVAESATIAGQRVNEPQKISDYLTMSETASWLALSDQVAVGLELATLVQIRNVAKL